MVSETFGSVTMNFCLPYWMCCFFTPVVGNIKDTSQNLTGAQPGRTRILIRIPQSSMPRWMWELLQILQQGQGTGGNPVPPAPRPPPGPVPRPAPRPTASPPAPPQPPGHRPRPGPRPRPAPRPEPRPAPRPAPRPHSEPRPHSVPHPPEPVPITTHSNVGETSL